MNLWSKINPMKVLKGVGGFIDESFQSREEVQIAIVQHYKTSLQETTPRSLTRRYIAVSVVGVYLFLLILAVVAYPFSSDYAAFVIEVAGMLTGLVVTIAIFYFGGYYGQKLLKSRKERKIELKEKEKDIKN